MLLLLGAFAVVPICCRGSWHASARERSTSPRCCRSPPSCTPRPSHAARRRGRHSVRDIRLDPAARHRAVDAHGHARLAHGPHRHGRRRARDALLPLVLPRQERGTRPVRRRAAGLRRRDVRARAHRRPRRARDVLGGHERPVVPAHRVLQPPRGEPPRGAAGTPRHDARRTRHADRRRAARRRRRHVEHLDDPRRGADRPGRRRRPGADPRRRAQQVGDLPVPLLAARRHGGADPGERLPARRGDGEGGHLPHRAPRARSSRSRPPGGRS